MSVNVSLTVSSSMSINLPKHKEPVEFDWDKVPMEKRQALAEYLINFGLRQSSGDAAAGVKGDADALKAVRAKFDKLQEGELPSGGGGRGSSLSEVEQAMLALLNENRKTADKLKVGDFRKAAAEYFRRALVADCEAEGIDPKTAGITETVKDNLDAMIEERINEREDGKEFLRRIQTMKKTVNVEKVSGIGQKWLKKTVKPVK